MTKMTLLPIIQTGSKGDPLQRIFHTFILPM